MLGRQAEEATMKFRKWLKYFIILLAILAAVIGIFVLASERTWLAYFITVLLAAGLVAYGFTIK